MYVLRVDLFYAFTAVALSESAMITWKKLSYYAYFKSGIGIPPIFYIKGTLVSNQNVVYAWLTDKSL